MQEFMVRVEVLITKRGANYIWSKKTPAKKNIIKLELSNFALQKPVHTLRCGDVEMFLYTPSGKVQLVNVDANGIWSLGRIYNSIPELLYYLSCDSKDVNVRKFRKLLFDEECVRNAVADLFKIADTNKSAIVLFK